MVNTSDGENMEQLGATTEAVTGTPKVQNDDERGPDTDSGESNTKQAVEVEDNATEAASVQTEVTQAVHSPDSDVAGVETTSTTTTTTDTGATDANSENNNDR
jgi:hypothetical protein